MRYSQNKEEAKDILQEGLIRIFDNLHQYQKDRGAFSTWSCRVIVNTALRYQKKHLQHNKWEDLDSKMVISDEEMHIESPVANEILVTLIQ